jgi:hypothetical protein
MTGCWVPARLGHDAIPLAGLARAVWSLSKRSCNHGGFRVLSSVMAADMSDRGDPTITGSSRSPDRSSGIISRPANRSRTPSSRTLSDGCVTSCSTRRCSLHSRMCAKL